MSGAVRPAYLQVGARSYRIAPIAELGVEALPYTLRLLVENAARRTDGSEPLNELLAWSAAEPVTVQLWPSRIFMHDTNGVPVLLDLAALRDIVATSGGCSASVNPRVPTELVVDHSIVADAFGTAHALEQNVRLEYVRNAERYRFLRWAQQAFANLLVVPPGNGIMHPLNAERLAHVVHDRDG